MFLTLSAPRFTARKGSKSDKNNFFFLDFKINPKQALNDKETDYEPASIKNFEAPLDDVIGQVGSKFISANQVLFSLSSFQMSQF